MLSLSCPASFSKHLNFGKTIFSLCAGFHIYNRTWKTLFPSNYAPWQLIKSNGANLISRVKDFPANSCDRYPPPLVKRQQRTFDHEMEISVPWLSGVFLKVSTQNFETVPVSYPKVQFINYLCWLLNFWNRYLPFPPRPPIHNVSFLLVQRLGENFLDLKKRKCSKVLMWHLDLVFPCYLSFLWVSLLNFCWGLRKFFRLESTKRESSR